MSVESDVQAATQAPAAPAANPALMGLPTFLPGAICLGLWLVGYATGRPAVTDREINESRGTSPRR